MRILLVEDNHQIAQSIARSHRGEITVDSQLHLGSCFQVKLHYRFPPDFLPFYLYTLWSRSLSGSASTITTTHYPIVIMRIWQLLCGSVLVLNMAGCANKTASVENSTATPKAAFASTAKSSTGKAPGFMALQGTIESTKKAIEAFNLAIFATGSAQKQYE